VGYPHPESCCSCKAAEVTAVEQKPRNKFLSLDAEMFTSSDPRFPIRKSKSKKKNKKSKKRSRSKSKDESSPLGFVRNEQSSFRLPLMEHIMMKPLGANNNNHNRDSGNSDPEEEAHESSGSSGDLILPAITVPKNYDGNLNSLIHEQQQEAEIISSTAESTDHIVQICIDSPSEEEASFSFAQAFIKSASPTPHGEAKHQGPKDGSTVV